MKNILIMLVMMFALPTMVRAVGIDLSVVDTNITTDEVARISVSISGAVDGGQVLISGLDNFEVVGQQSSQSIQAINGQTTQVQKNEITVKPKKSGNFVVTASAKAGGKEISSQSATIKVAKSLIETTKDDLLQNIPQTSAKQNLSAAVSNEATENQDSVIDFDVDSLKKSQNLPMSQRPAEDEAQASRKNEQQSQALDMKNFPQIESLSVFNAMFWLEFAWIVLGVIIIVIGALWFIFQKKKKKRVVKS